MPCHFLCYTNYCKTLQCNRPTSFFVIHLCSISFYLRLEKCKKIVKKNIANILIRSIVHLKMEFRPHMVNLLLT